MSWVIEGCSSPIATNTYTIEFAGNDIIFFNPRPIITINYISPHSYLIFMDNNLSFTTLNRTADIHNDGGQYMTVSCSTVNVLPHTVCDVQIMDNHDIVHVKFIRNIDNFNTNDYYQFKIGTALDNTIKAYARAFRTKTPLLTTTPNDMIIGDTITSSDMNDEVEKKVKIPIIIIEGQTNVDATNLGDMKFTIRDKYCYYNHKSIIGTKCGKFYAKGKLKETIFRKYGKDISLDTVLKGKGHNALEKAQYLYKKDKKLQSPFYEFYYNNLTLYAMVKYILSYLLYGNYDIKYVLGKYNDKFYKNLANSRFCHFIDFFVDNKLISYNKYFKYC